jgi:hypothetical protein
MGETMLKNLLTTTVMLLMIAACSRVNVGTTEGDPQQLAGLKTYSWLEEGGVEASPTIQNPRVEDWVMASVDKQLKRKGYSRVNAGSGDFVVTWIGAVEEKIKHESVSHFYRNYGYGAVFSGKAESKADAVAYEYQEGTLILDFFDPVTKTTLLHRSATGRLLREMNDEQAQLYIDTLVDSLLRDLPGSG